MCPQDVIFGGHRRGHSVQINALQRAKDSVHAGHLFRVAGRRDVIKAIDVGNQCSLHHPTKSSSRHTDKPPIHLAR
jgi:hypothetical protein